MGKFVFSLLLMSSLLLAGPPELDVLPEIAEVTSSGEPQPDGWWIHTVWVEGRFTRVRMPFEHTIGDTVEVRRDLSPTDKLIWIYLETIETAV